MTDLRPFHLAIPVSDLREAEQSGRSQQIQKPVGLLVAEPVRNPGNKVSHT